MHNLAEWFRRHFKIDPGYAVRNSSWMVSNQVVGVVVSLILSIAFAYFVPKDVFGTYKYVLSIVGIISAFTLSGMNTSIIQAVARGFEATFKRSISVQLKWSTVALAVGLGMAGYYAFNGNLTLAIPLLAVAIAIPLSSAANTYSAFLQGKKEFKVSSIYAIISSCMYLVWMFAIIWFGGGVVALAVGYIVVQLASNALFYFVTVRRYRIDGGNDESAIGYGKHLSLMNVLGSIAAQIDSVIIFQFLGPVNLAIYSFAVTIPERIRSFFNFTGTLVMPSLSNQSIDTARSTIKQKLAIMGTIGVAMIAIYVLVAPFIFRWFFPQYADSILYSQVFSISMIVIVANISLSTLFSQRLKTELYIFTTANPIIRIILLAVFVYLYGIWGAIISRIIASFIHLGSSIYLIYRKR